MMFLSTLIHFKKFGDFSEFGLNPLLSLIGLVNWIPFFLCFWGFQQYLSNEKKRTLVGKFFIYGSIPVIFSGILQLLNVNGPFQLFNGLVVWFQKPLENVGSLSGLFNNQNYAGLWMVMVWPFCLSELKKKSKQRMKKIIVFIICILFVIFISLTDSRNALLGLIISSPMVLGSGSLIWYLPTIIIGLTLLAFTVVPIFPEELQIFMKSIIPSRVYTLFPEIGFKYLSSYPRVSKWIAATNLVFEKPIFGWGAASFPILYQIKSGEWFGHAHNLPLEMAVSYGLLPAIIIFSTYLCILYLSFKKIFRNNENNNENSKFNQRAWLASSLIFFLSHLVDIQYFDARISIFCWILLAGLTSFIKEKNQLEIVNK